MIEVIIRHTDEAISASLGKFEPSKLDSIVQLVKEYGCYTNDGKGRFLSAHFMSDNQAFVEVYFEIIIE